MFRLSYVVYVAYRCRTVAVDSRGRVAFVIQPEAPYRYVGEAYGSFDRMTVTEQRNIHMCDLCP